MDKYDNLYYRVKGKGKKLYHSILLLTKKEDFCVLRNNSQLHNKYFGKRCFVVGNGPSLNSLDLGLIKNEYTFTVNYFMRSTEYQKINNDFHIMMDPIVFEQDRLKELENINVGDHKPICFFPIQAMKNIKNAGLEGILNIHYIYCCYQFYEKFNETIDICKPSPGFANSVLYCTMIALYLGFKEIIYIGCDMTGYEQLSIVAGKGVDLHAYKMSDYEKEQIIQRHSTMSNEVFFEGFMNTFAEFRKLREYTDRRGVKMFNATKGGVLNSIERIDYNMLFKK